MRKSFAVCRRAFGFFIVVSAFALTALAQDFSDRQKNNSTEEGDGASSPQTDAATDEKNQFTVWSAFAPDIPRVFGGSRRSTFGEFGFQYSRRIATSRNVALKYTIDAIPLAIINYEQQRITQLAPTFVVDRNKTTAYGAGLTPVGFQLNFRRQSKVQPFVTAQAGLLVFNKSIPDDRSAIRPNERGRQFNFTLAGGGGVEFLNDDARSYILGFKFHHISNASTGNINPGFDQNLFYFGYTFKKF